LDSADKKYHEKNKRDIGTLYIPLGILINIKWFLFSGRLAKK